MSLTMNMIGGGSGIPGNRAVLVARIPSGSTVTATKGGIVLTPMMWVSETYPDQDIALFVFTPAQFDSVNPWTITATDGTNTASTTIFITTNKEYEVTLSYLVPAEYQAVEYLERPEQSGAYYNTGIVPTATTFVEIKYKFITYAGFPWPIGCKIASSNWWGVNISTAGNTNFYYNTSSAVTGISGYANTDNVVQWVDGNKIRASNDNGATFTEYSKTQTYTPTNPFFIFAPDASTVQKGANDIRITRVTIADAELIPCYRKSDSTPGFWNKRDEVFITKTGTDSILVGPDL